MSAGAASADINDAEHLANLQKMLREFWQDEVKEVSGRSCLDWPAPPM